VLTVSRLEDRYKGHDVVLRAMPLVRAKLKDAQWRVVGDGPLRPNLEARAHALGLGEAVTFLGQLSDDQRDEEFMRADVFCMVSRLPATGLAGEGFGIVYLEAGARLLPSVAANEGGGADAVLDGQTGVQVDPEDHVGLAEVLVSLLSDRRYAARLGRAGRDHAAELQWDVIARSVEAEILALTG
jgi:phosphatidylinositol alpha-1,6-mannosyltransferase